MEDKLGHAAIRWTERQGDYTPIKVHGWVVSDNSDDDDLTLVHPAGYVLTLMLNEQAERDEDGGELAQVVFTRDELRTMLAEVEARTGRNDL